MTPVPTSSGPYRDYQLEASARVQREWANHTPTAVVAATGLGKTAIGAHLASVCYGHGLPVLLMAHQNELLKQFAREVQRCEPHLPPVGIVAADRNEVDAPIVAASIQTLMVPGRLEQLGPRRVVLWDEVHHAEATTWKEIPRRLGVLDGNGFFCGLTATLRREDGRALRSIIKSVAIERDLRWAIKNGYLVQPQGRTVELPDFDLSQARVVAGEYVSADIDELVEASLDSIVTTVLRECADRRPIVFVPGVETAEMLASALTAAGYGAQSITGRMPHDERSVWLQAFRENRIRALVTVQVLTEGVDLPQCDAIVIARPTRSQTLYSQMVGRGLRLHTYPDGTEKTDSLIVDVVGVTRQLDLVSLTDLDGDAHVVRVDVDGNELPPDEEDAAAAPVNGRALRMGPIPMTSIDLLEADSALWFETTGRVPFLSVVSYTDKTIPPLYVVLVPQSDGTFRPAWMPQRGGGGGWIGEATDLTIARDVVLDWMVDNGRRAPLRAAKWRYGPPSDKQLNFARSLGIPDFAAMNKARLSDEITIVLASRTLDRRFSLG